MAFVSVSTPAYAEATAATTIGAAFGGGVTVNVGDLMIACVAQSSGTPTNPNSAPASWTLQDNVSNTSQTPNIRQHYYFKTAVSGDTSKPTYTWGFAVSRDLSLTIIVLTNQTVTPVTLNTNYSMKGNGFAASSSWVQQVNAITDVDPNELYIVFTAVSGMIGSTINARSCDSGFTELFTPTFAGGQSHATVFTWQAGNQTPNAPRPSVTWGFTATKTGTLAASILCIQSKQIELDAAQGNAAPTDTHALTGTIAQAETNAAPTDDQALTGNIAASESNAAPSDTQSLAGTIAQTETNAAPTDAQSLAGTLTTAAETNAAPTDSQSLAANIAAPESNAAPSDAQTLASSIAQTEANAAPSDAQSIAATVAQTETNAAPSDAQSLSGAISQPESNAAPADAQSLTATVSQAESNAAPVDAQSLTPAIVQTETNAAPSDAQTLSGKIAQTEANPAPADAQSLAGSISQSESNASPTDAQGLAGGISQTEGNPSPTDGQAFSATITQAETNASPVDGHVLQEAIIQGESNDAPTDAHSLTAIIVQSEANDAPVDAYSIGTPRILILANERNLAPVDTGRLIVVPIPPPNLRANEIFTITVDRRHRVTVPQGASGPPSSVTVFEEVIS